MSGVQIGVGLALAAALMTNLASLLKHRGCQHAEPVNIRFPLRTARHLAGSRWFLAGWGVAAVAWLIHVAALSLAPISLVQAVLAGGAASLAVMAQRFFGHPVAWRQWLALGLGATGLVLLVVTVPGFSSDHSGFSLAGMLGFESGLLLLAAGLAAGHRSERFDRQGSGIVLAIFAGTLFAIGGIAIKGLTGAGSVSVAVLAPWVLLIVAAGVLAQYAAAAALQRGEAIETIGMMGLVTTAAQIVGGILVFGDPLSPSPLGLALQGSAFAMVCASALLLPAPRSAAAAQRA
jgi:drug/metabolite transporter (DMT)-like permease